MKQCRISRDALIASEMKKTKPIRKLLAANRSESQYASSAPPTSSACAPWPSIRRRTGSPFTASRLTKHIKSAPARALWKPIWTLRESSHWQREGRRRHPPGYGFLSENPAFARACEKAGITFVGPPPNLLELLGDKTAARRLAASAGVPVLPGTENPVKSAAEAQKIAREIGYPLIVKAAMGGGGRGMRVVHDATQLDAFWKKPRVKRAPPLAMLPSSWRNTCLAPGIWKSKSSRSSR